MNCTNWFREIISGCCGLPYKVNNNYTLESNARGKSGWFQVSHDCYTQNLSWVFLILYLGYFKYTLVNGGFKTYNVIKVG